MVSGCASERAGYRHVIIDLGAGPQKYPGSFGLDILLREGVDVICNLEHGIPIRSETVDFIFSAHVVEHIRNFIPLMEEIYRICKPGAEVWISVPYFASRAAFNDPTHVNYFTEVTWQYFEPPTYGIKTNFRIESIVFATRRPFCWFPEYIQKRFFRRYFWNVCEGMTVTLRAVKETERMADDPVQD